MANRQAAWRTSGERTATWQMKPATRQPLRTPAHHQTADRNDLYQLLRGSLSGCADEHATTLSRYHRHDTFRP